MRKNLNNPEALFKLFPNDDVSSTIPKDFKNTNYPESSKHEVDTNNPPPQSQISSKSSVNPPPQSQISSKSNVNPSQSKIYSDLNIMNNNFTRESKKDNPPKVQPDEVIFLGEGDYMTPEEMNLGGPETIVYEKEVLKCAGAGQESKEIKSPIINIPQKPSRINKGISNMITRNLKGVDDDIDNKKESKAEGFESNKQLEKNDLISDYNEIKSSNIFSSFLKNNLDDGNKYQASSSIIKNENGEYNLSLKIV